jgi:hypothetical protein
MNQKQQILNWLKKHKKVTSITAIGMFGITRLSAVIYALRADGYEITSNRKPAEKSGTYVEYVLIEPQKECVVSEDEPKFGVEDDSSN